MKSLQQLSEWSDIKSASEARLSFGPVDSSLLSESGVEDSMLPLYNAMDAWFLASRVRFLQLCPMKERCMIES